jgi:hypothetical protein
MAVQMGMNSLERADTAKRQDERISVWIRVSDGFHQTGFKCSKHLVMISVQ